MDNSIGHQWHNFLLLENHHHHHHHHHHHYNQCCNMKLKLMILQFNISLQQNRINASASSAHGILAFLFPILLAFLQLKTSVKEASSPSSDLFETRPIIPMLSISSLLAYCLALGASLGFPCYARSFHIAAVFLGSLSVSSLASLLLPHILFPLPYIIYVLVILVPAVLLRMFFPPGHHHFSSQSSRSWHNTTTLFTNIFGRVVMHPLLPVTTMDSQQEQ